MHSIWLVLVLSILSSSVTAGTLGDLTYRTVRGERWIEDCRESAEGELVIPSQIEGLPVTGILDGAFAYCARLTSIVIPDGVASIGSSAMAIDEGAFTGCSRLASISIPDTVTVIGTKAFYLCGRLESVTIPDSVVDIGALAFAQCFRLSSVIIGNGVEEIGISAFADCSRLASITIPNSVTTIGSGAFENCLNLTSVTIPESVSSIYYGAFTGCFALETIVVPPAFFSRAKANEIGEEATRELWGNGYMTTSANNQPPATAIIQPSIRMAPVIMVQGEEGSVKTIEVADSPDGPWQFWMDVTATASGVAITDLDGQAHKRFYRVRE